MEESVYTASIASQARCAHSMSMLSILPFVSDNEARGLCIMRA